MNSEMKAKLEKYMKSDGYYDTLRIRKEEGYTTNAARFFDIFGSDDDQAEPASDILSVAVAYNEAKMKGEPMEETEVVETEILNDETGEWEVVPERRTVDAEDESEPSEVSRHSFEYEDGAEATYIIFKDGNTYTLDAEWSDGPAWSGNCEPSAAEIEAIHEEYKATMAFYNTLQ